MLNLQSRVRVEHNSFRCLNAGKETKILFFVQDISGEKLSQPTHPGEIFLRLCAVLALC